MGGIVGNRVLRTEDPRLLTGRGSFVADVADPLLQNAVHATYVRSSVAHARIVDIDVSDAVSAPGVVAVLTGDTLGLEAVRSDFAPRFSRCLLAKDIVRFVGEAVAVVLTETVGQGHDAAELVAVDYDPLPAIVDVAEAERDEVLLFPDVGTNTCVDGSSHGVPARDPTLFEACEVVVEMAITNQRLAPCPLEVRAGAAAWTPEGQLVQWASSQVPHRLRDTLARMYGEAARPRVIVQDVGGGFGPRSGRYPEELALGAIAAVSGRPVRWTETRTESMQGLSHGRAQRQRITIGGTCDGRVRAYRLDIVQDAGAYPDFGAVLPGMLTRPLASSVYDIPRVECEYRCVLTNTTPVSAYRGAGRPEAVAAIERAMDLFAAELGLDPVDVRRRNLVPPFSEPHTTPLGTVYDVGDFGAALDRVLAAARYDELRDEQCDRRERGHPRQLGIGTSCYVEMTGQSDRPSVPGSEVARVTVETSGAITVQTGTAPHGQSHDTAWAMIAAHRLGVSIDRIRVVHGDTDVVPVGSGTFASRSLQQGGMAVECGATDLMQRARHLAANLLEADPEDIVANPQHHALHVVGSPAVSIGWAELARAGLDNEDPLDVKATFVSRGPTFPFGAHLAVVEVDIETGQVELLRFYACDDAGIMLNPTIAEGQIHGGVAQGVAQALLEEVRYDRDGNPMTSNFADYALISAAELPNITVVRMETPTPYNALGAKGIGESGTIGAAPAVQSAVVDALSPFGVRHIDMPATPQRVWEALRAHGLHS